MLRYLDVLAASRGRPLRLTALGVASGRIPTSATIGSVEIVEHWSPDDAATNAVRAQADVERSGLWIDLRQDGLAIEGGTARARAGRC